MINEKGGYITSESQKTEIAIVEEKALKSGDMIEAFKMLKGIVKVNIDKLCQ